MERSEWKGSSYLCPPTFSNFFLFSSPLICSPFLSLSTPSDYIQVSNHCVATVHKVLWGWNAKRTLTGHLVEEIRVLTQTILIQKIMVQLNRDRICCDYC